MITNVCLLLEILSIVFCVHCLYGEKFKLDIATTSYLAVHMIILTAINYYKLPKVYTMIAYPIMFIYCGVRFGFRLKEMIINNILYMVIVSGLQLLILLPYYYFFEVSRFSTMKLLMVNCISFAIIVMLIPKCRLDKLSIYLQNKERLLMIAFIICICVAIYCLFSFKKVSLVELNQSILLFISITFICILSMQLTKYRVKSKEIETELKMHQLYADSFHSLTENIRLRQHEFDNHINTIYSQHFMYNTYEELVKAQENYCHIVLRENRYNKLLTSGNPVVLGFLYGKFVEVEKKGIDIQYKICIDDLDVDIPVYKLVEIIGNLINNAVDALEFSGQNKYLYVAMVEDDNTFIIEVRNKSEYIEQNEIDLFFKKGFSKKGENRGLGLYNVKCICNECSLYLFCENKNIEDENWLSFVISNKKEII